MEWMFTLGVGLYAVTTAGYLASLWTAHAGVSRAARWALWTTLSFWAGLLAWWLLDVGAAAGVRLWIGVSAWSLSALYLALSRRYPIQSLGSFVVALSTLLSVLTIHVSHADAVVAAPLASWLLRIHIGLAFIGVTAFAFATAVSLVYLLQAHMLKRKSHGALRRRLPPLDVLDRLALRSITVGFPFYTLALLLGSAYAIREGADSVKLVYGLALVSWLIYGGVLQARLTAGWRGRRAAVLTTVGLFFSMVVVASYTLGVT